jgi:hypothetical protein
MSSRRFVAIAGSLAHASAVLMLSVFPTVAKSAAGTALKLILPSNVTIHLADSKSISGVRLATLSPSQVAFEKGGRRTLQLAEVARIAFQGAVELKAKGEPVFRGVSLKGCGRQREILVSTESLEIQPDGASLALNPDRLPSAVLRDLRQTIAIKTLVVESLLFDPGGKVRLLYKACSPGA